jgi:hypothetical protein
MISPTVTVEFVNMGAYNQLHFPGFPSGGLSDLFAYMKVVLFLFTMTRGDGEKRSLGTSNDRNRNL